jgi:2-iminobutanoate/2-iminopropanoate deaminase
MGRTAPLKYIESAKSVKPIGPYSQAVSENGFIFVAGTIGVDPATNAMVPGGIREQTARVLENMKAVLEEGGCSLQKVLKVTVFIKDGAHFREMNEVYASHFGGHKPARSTVVCGFPRDDILVEIESVASL